MNAQPPIIKQASIEWLSWDQAVAKMKNQPRKMLIDVYTDWCGWCKRMDMTTFADPAVVQNINEHFYAVKLDAEQKENIVFDQHTFAFVNEGRRGFHELAASLLDNQMSYPSFVLMDEKIARITIVKGFQQANDFNCILNFIAKNNYQNTTFETFKKTCK